MRHPNADDPMQITGDVQSEKTETPNSAEPARDTVSMARFQWRAITWLKAHRDLRSTVRPEDRLDEHASGGTRFTGWFARPSTAGWWFYAALCALLLGATLAMFNPPGTSKATRAAAAQAGYVASVAGAACLVVAEAKRRRNRQRALVELRAAEGQPATADSIAELSKAADGASACLVTEQPLAPELLTQAREQGVRCFVANRRWFDDAELPPGDLPRPPGDFPRPPSDLPRAA